MHEESDFQVKNNQSQQPEAKKYQSQNFETNPRTPHFSYFSIFRFFYGFFILLSSYYITTSFDDGFLITGGFLVLSIFISRKLFKKFKLKFNL